jgi:hypothetical protein
MKKFIIPILLFCVGYANQVKAEDTDLTGIDNVIYVAPQTVAPGEKATLSICMKNTAAIRGFQFDMYLPTGVTAVKNNKGRYICSFTADRLPEDDEHTLTLGAQGDGAIRFLCGSQYDETFTGNDGEIATIQIEVASDVVEGEYPILLKNMKLTETDISKYYETAEVESTLTVTVTTGIKSAEVQQDGVIYNLQGQKLNAPKKGINIQTGKKVVVK